MNDEVRMECSTCAWWRANPNYEGSGECRGAIPAPTIMVHRTREEADEMGRKGYVVTVWPATWATDRCRGWMPSDATVERVGLARQQDAADLAGRH